MRLMSERLTRRGPTGRRAALAAAAALLACAGARAEDDPLGSAIGFPDEGTAADGALSRGRTLDRRTKLALDDLKSDDSEVRENAVRRLRLLAAERGQHVNAVPAIIGALSDADPRVRATAAEMLRSLFSRPDMPDSPAAWQELWRRMKDRFEAEQSLDPTEHMKRERAKLENDKGFHFMMLGDFKVAEKYFLDAVASHPRNPQYWNNLGKCLSNQGRFPDAVDRFRRALEEDPGYVPTHYNLAETFLDISRLTGTDRTYEALGHAEVALRLDRDGTDWAARWLKARILLGMAMPERTVTGPYKDMGPERDTIGAAGHMSAADRYEIYKRAERAIAEAVHIAPNVPEVRKTAALVYYGRELYFKSFKEIRKVYDLGYTMDDDFLKKLEEALKKEAYAIGATPPEMPTPQAGAKKPDEKSPALMVPYRDGALQGLPAAGRR
jgi:tetratricopeptide (TPR) repeat protein